METTPRFRDKVKDTFKDREIKKTVTTHWQKNKDRYIVGALCFVGGALIVKKTPDLEQSVRTLIQVGSNDQSVSNTAIGTQHNYNTPKRLSYIITDGTNWWQTQNEAALAIGEHPKNVSKHLNHNQPLKSGAQLERVGVRS